MRISLSDRILKAGKSAVYEAGIACINFIGILASSVAGFGAYNGLRNSYGEPDTPTLTNTTSSYFSNTTIGNTTILNSTTISHISDITNSHNTSGTLPDISFDSVLSAIAIAGGIAVITSAGISYILDLYKCSDHLAGVLKEKLNTDEQTSEWKSFRRRTIAIHPTPVICLFTTKLMGFSFADSMTTTLIAGVGTAIVVPTVFAGAIAGREIYATRKINTARQQSAPEITELASARDETLMAIDSRNIRAPGYFISYPHFSGHIQHDVAQAAVTPYIGSNRV